MKKVLNKKKAIIFGIGGLILIGITAFLLFKFDVFGSNTPDDRQKSEEKEVENKPVEEVKHLQIVDENSNTRPFAVMINNISTARPYQSGLQEAYIIYELIVEGGITRYLALFKDQNTARIGSIRSARHYYLDYVLENDAIYVHHGQSPQAQNDFSALGIDRIVADNNKTGWRDKSLPVSSEHTLFTSIEKLNNGTKGMRTTTEQSLLLKYSVDEIDMSSIQNAKVANNVSITYSSNTTSSYVYDGEKKVYYRSVNNKPHIDYSSKEQYYFKNIITYQVENYTLKDPDNKGRQGLNNIGSGTGYYISNGYAIPIKWEKKSRAGQTKYYYENGEELKVNDGNTFIQIQPKNQKLSIS